MYSGKYLLYSGKMVVFGQICFYSEKVVVLGEK